MLKLNTSYSKKVPAESEYSSKSYHASIEMELPDGLTEQQIKDRIHGTFDLVRETVETEIGAQTPKQAPASNPPRNGYGQSQKPHNDPASSKQIKYLLDLAKVAGMTPSEIVARAGARSIDELTRQQCSKLIDELGRKAA
jgi:hypothetical protein